MTREERFEQLMQEAESLGLRLKFDAGLVVVIEPQAGDPDRQEALYAKLARYIPDVRSFVERRASGARAKNYLGARIWLQDGPGNLLAGSEDGTISVRVSAEMRRSDEDEAQRRGMTVNSNAEALLIFVRDEGTADAAAPGNEPTSEQPKEGFFQRLRRG
jgi:hypothetical protein